MSKTENETVTSRHEGERAEIPSAVDFLWGTKEPTNRGPKPALSIERIAQVALRIADAEGLAAVSMHRVASDLDFTKMSLYRYVAGKDELLAAMIELAVGPPPDLSRVRSGWRAKVEEFVRQLAVTWDEHPWLPWATMGERVVGPNEMGWIEGAVACFADIGLTGSEQLDAVFVLFGHIRNTQSMSTAGTHPWTTDKHFHRTVRAMVPDYETRFPAVTAAVDRVGPRPSLDNGRAFGLARLLDGIELLVAKRSNKR